MSVMIFITGGTFDKEYDEIKGELYFKDTHMREILELGRSKLDVKIKNLMLIDSLDMQEEDRNVILEHCQSTNILYTRLEAINGIISVSRLRNIDDN